MGRKKKKKKSLFNTDISVIGLIVVSIILMILIYAQKGYIGEVLSPILGGILGWIKYIIPIGTLAIAIYLICDDKDYFVRKIILYVIFLVCVSTIISINQFSRGTIDISHDMESIVKDAYTLGTENIGGGAIGAIIAVPLIKLIGVLGGIILSIGVAIITVVIVFGLKPAEMFVNYFNNRKERKAIKKEEVQEQKIEKPIITSKKEKNIKDNLEKSPNILEPNLFRQEETQKEDKVKEVLTLEHTLTVEDEHYEFPEIGLLAETKGTSSNKGDKKTVESIALKLQKTLHSFGVVAKVEKVSVGPAITRYELKPAEGVRVSKIASLSDDIALNLAAESIRIEAPIPGKQAVGIEIPNKEKEIVHLRDIIDSNEFKGAKSKLSFALGKDVAGDGVVADIEKMPHVLIAGSTGSGKSVCINTLVTSIIYKAKPSEVKLVMIDPKVVELSTYNGIPHLLIPVITDPKKAAGALAWAVQEMVNRYGLFAQKGVRDIKSYNENLEKNGEKLPQIVIIIDELADLMMVAEKDVEDAICRLAQMARAAGMHLVIATQRPSVDVITGIIKANIPSRISFAVTSSVDSRTILDSGGAEKLLGKGDMLFYPTGVLKPQRIQGAFISDKEVEKVVEFLKLNCQSTYNEEVLEKIEKANSTDKEIEEDDETDKLLPEAIDMVVEIGQASTSFIQRRFKVGYARAGRIIDQLEARGIISGYEGSKPRKVLITKEQLQELKMTNTEENSEDDNKQ